jgi:hypothetical protein
MAGMSLAQAGRLFGLDSILCERLMNELVHSGLLRGTEGVMGVMHASFNDSPYA